MSDSDYSKTSKVNHKNKLCLSFSKLLCKILTFSNVMKCFGTLLVLSYLFSYIYTETYIWQCNTLANVLRPVKRTSCPINNIKQSKVDSIQGLSTTNNHNNSSYKIGMVMIYDRNYGNLDHKIVARIISNREYYCKLHGYQLIIAHSEEEEEITMHGVGVNDSFNNNLQNNVNNKEQVNHVKRPAAWYKLTTMLRHLSSNRYDYLLYIDMDVVIMNYSIPLESYIMNSNQHIHDFIMTSDWSGLNTGIWFAKNTIFTRWFLKKAFDQTQLIAKYSKDGIPHPFEYEQRAFHFLLNTPVWQNRKLPSYKPQKDDHTSKGVGLMSNYSSKSLQSHFQFLPQCALNSYVMHPFEFRGDREVSQYIETDFLVHLAGKKGKIKSDLINYYLDIAESNRRLYSIHDDIMQYRHRSMDNSLDSMIHSHNNLRSTSSQ